MLRHVHLEILCRGLFFVTYFERFLVHICNGASGLVQQQSKMDSFSFCHCKIKLTNEFSSWVAHEIWSQRPTYNKTCFCETRKLIWYRLFLLTFFFFMCPRLHHYIRLRRYLSLEDVCFELSVGNWKNWSIPGCVCGHSFRMMSWLSLHFLNGVNWVCWFERLRALFRCWRESGEAYD